MEISPGHSGSSQTKAKQALSHFATLLGSHSISSVESKFKSYNLSLQKEASKALNNFLASDCETGDNKTCGNGYFSFPSCTFKHDINDTSWRLDAPQIISHRSDGFLKS
uniref:Uncharacterized protein n=1 Tax=Corethron hystrix TaxID=216773 RepID=A0A7S1BJJ7_9STRA|mmetsp:Transcript_28025/g.64155  ORF Transcript_28025/g.64155 Transcript_28025/m.64155 type:complete len:109 (+) Transcript_28025:224-550(+)